ncbi:unnamed protein product [Rhizophagus irregularis]|nr:unnamed protein product [Rhizophagus irregularis]
MFKRKASLPLTTPNSIIHLSLGYAIKDINTIQAQRQLSRLYNQVISKGVMKDIFEVDCKQLQSELLSNKSPLATWNISLKDLQVKHCLLAHVSTRRCCNTKVIRQYVNHKIKWCES